MLAYARPSHGPFATGRARLYCIKVQERCIHPPRLSRGIVPGSHQNQSYSLTGSEDELTRCHPRLHHSRLQDTKPHPGILTREMGRIQTIRARRLDTYRKHIPIRRGFVLHIIITESVGLTSYRGPKKNLQPDRQSPAAPSQRGHALSKAQDILSLAAGRARCGSGA